VTPGEAIAAKDAAREALRRGDAVAALAHAERAVALAPSLPEAWVALGTVRLVMGDAAAACTHLDRAVTLAPLLAEARLNLSVALMSAGRLDEARAALFAAATVDPGLDVRAATERLLVSCRAEFSRSRRPETAARLATVLQAARLFDEAADVLRQILADFDADADLWSLLGQILLAGRRHDEAVLAALEADHRAPGDVAHIANAAGILADKGDLAAAVAMAERAAQRFPDSCRPHLLLADLTGRTDAAAEWRHMVNAADAADATAAALSRACFAAYERSDWAVVERLRPRLDAALRTGEGVQPLRLAVMPYGAAELHRNAEAFSRAQWPARRPLAAAAAAKPRLRLGYLSADFRAHPVGTTILDLFRHHDRSRHEVRLYAVGATDDGPEQRALAAAADAFTTLGAVSDLDAARRIRDDGIDILLELGGHTKNARPGILSYRPAPVQMHFLGYPGTTGAGFVDYIVGDPWTIPPEAERYFTECILRLPVPALINTPRPPAAAARSRSAYGLPEAAVVLSSFNHSHKITPQLFAVWCDILAALPEAVLWLRSSLPETAATLRDAARRRGLDPARLLFAPRVALAEHFARYRVCDLMLDTTPYGAHSTAADALWMGCPLVTLAGETFAARVCAGLLDAAGMGECIAVDLDDYRIKAVELARDAAARSVVKAKAEQARHGLLFDTRAFTRWFELGLETAWTRAAAGLPPATVNVPRVPTDETGSA
jgi:predicted O-linked N-acetylglucosamine transferase (SPINDLY family)